MRKLTHQFTFAGFSFPRYIADLAIGHAAMRKKREQRKFISGYYHAPRPGGVDGWGFYEGESSLRIERTGVSYYCDDMTMEAIIVRLNHGRGFLVGWTMGEGMAASIDSDILTDETEARRVAKSRCKDAAESECEYQQRENDRLVCEEEAEALGGVALWLEA